MVKSRILRLILLLVGFISLALGCVGIALPVLPTVPFFLLTSFCFVKSSQKFNLWFLNSKLYKKYVENFALTRAMTLRNEIILLLSVSAMLMITMAFVKSPVVPIILTVLIFFKYLYFILRVKPISLDEWKVMKKARKEKEDAILKKKNEVLHEYLKNSSSFKSFNHEKDKEDKNAR